MQVSVVELSLDEVVLGAPLAPNINHRHTVFGGSASALAILAAWSLVHVRLAAEGAAARLVIQRNTMSYDGPMGEDIDLLDRQNWDGQELTGAVLIVFRDDTGHAIGAWGRALPAGDFAAG